MMTNIITIAMIAILQVESSGGVDLRDGDGGRAVGAYQMWPVAVGEVNRIYGTSYTPADRRCFAKSTEMCRLTMEYHYKRGSRNPVDLACKWHRPYGRACPVYRRKIQSAIRNRWSRMGTI